MQRTTLVMAYILLYSIPTHGNEGELDVCKEKVSVYKPYSTATVDESDETPLDLLKKSDEESEEYQEAPQETANLEELLNRFEDITIPVPDIKEPSFLMRGIRSYGITLAYALLGVRQWLTDIFS